MHHKEIEPNFDASCQQILGLESEILWEARSMPTFSGLSLNMNNDQQHNNNSNNNNKVVTKVAFKSTTCSRLKTAC
jgi:hypothetical protein